MLVNNVINVTSKPVIYKFICALIQVKKFAKENLICLISYSYLKKKKSFYKKLTNYFFRCSF